MARDVGCLGAVRAEWFANRAQRKANLDRQLGEPWTPGRLSERGAEVRKDLPSAPLADWLRFDSVHSVARNLIGGDIDDLDDELFEEVIEDARYAPYLLRQDAELRDLRSSEAVRLDSDFPYQSIAGLSREMVERLTQARPDSLSAAGRVPGITPAALSAVLVHARRMAEMG